MNVLGRREVLYVGWLTTQYGPVDRHGWAGWAQIYLAVSVQLKT
jgi:hypothetical protein